MLKEPSNARRGRACSRHTGACMCQAYYTSFPICTLFDVIHFVLGPLQDLVRVHSAADVAAWKSSVRQELINPNQIITRVSSRSLIKHPIITNDAHASRQPHAQQVNPSQVKMKMNNQQPPVGIKISTTQSIRFASRCRTHSTFHLSYDPSPSK